MAEEYTVEAQREITDVDPNSGDLLDYWEVIAVSNPSGVRFSVRVPAKGATAETVQPLLAAKAAEYNKVGAL